jgi:hypothetical protein
MSDRLGLFKAALGLGERSTNPAGPAAATTSPPDAARTIAALLTLRDQVIVPIIAGVRSPTDGPQTHHLDPGGPRLRNLRIDLQTLFTHLGITTTPAAAA